MKQLAPLDSHFFYFESPNQPMMIGSLWLCDPSTAPHGRPRYRDILQYIGDRLNLTSYFRRRLEQPPLNLDDPYWLDDENFDLEYHIRHVGLPQPGDWRQLCIFTARTMSRSVDMERPPWEIYIIEGVNNVDGLPEGSFAVLIRFHHAYVDGKASFELTTALWEDSPTHEYGRRDKVEVAERQPTRLEMWARTTPQVMAQPWRAMRASLTFARKSAELAVRLRRDDRPQPIRAPKTIFNTTVTPHRSYGSASFHMPDLKRMRTLVPGASLNDVLVAIIAGGMRRYLNMHNQLPAESLVSMCPVSLRPEDVKGDVGNLLSAMYIAIGTDLDDPVERLAAVHRRTQWGIPLAREVLFDLTNAAGKMLPSYVRAWGVNMQNRATMTGRAPLFNTITTNVPGISGMQPKYFAGAKVCSISPMVPVFDGVAVTHGMLGIYDSMNIGILADRKVVPDIDVYIDCMYASYREYLESAEYNEFTRAHMEKARKTQLARLTGTPADGTTVLLGRKPG